MEAIPLIFFSLAISLVAVRRFGLLPFPSLLAVTCIVVQVVFLLVHEGTLDYSMLKLMDRGGVAENYFTVQLLYSGMALLALVAAGNRGALTRKVLSAVRGQRVEPRFLVAVVLLCLAHVVVFLLLVDLTKVWLHETYLEPLGDDSTMRDMGPLVTSVAGALSLFAIAASWCVAIAVQQRAHFVAFFAGVICLFYFLILLGAHSRTAAFVPATFMISSVSSRRTLLTSVFRLLLLLGVVLALASALANRNGGRHGLASVPTSVLNVFDTLGALSTQVLTDFSQGGPVTAESIQVTASFAGTYEVLSFSPLPSAIDGYSSVRVKSEHKLAAVIPMSGIGEAFHFGPFAIAVVVCLFMLAGRLNIYISGASPRLFLLANALLMFAGYDAFTYPLRNALKYLWISLGMSMLAYYRSRRGRADIVPARTAVPTAPRPAS